MHVYATLQLLKKHLQIFILCVLLFSVPPASAALVSVVDVNYGYTALNLKYFNTSSSLSAPSGIEINYLLKHQAISTAYFMSFYEMLEGGGAKVPYSRFAFGFRYYPMGFNGSRLIVDQGASAQIWKATPFIGIHMGLANVSLGNTLPAEAKSNGGNVNASLTEIAPRFGVEIPFTVNTLGQAQLILHSGTGSSSAASQISYTGVSAMVGLVLVGF